MSRIRADRIVDRAATGAPLFPNGAVITGIATATTFSGNLTGNASGTAGGLSGTPNISVGSVSGTTGTFTGSVSIGGTLTYEDVTNVDSVGLVTARAGIAVLGAGITATGVSTFHSDLHVSGVVEKVAAATTYQSGNDMVLELDVTNSTTYRYTMSGGNIGIVSFKNMPADRENGSTVTVLFTQNSTTPAGGIGNTTAALGIGTHCVVAPTGVAGMSTAGLVGSATTVTLSSTASDVDFVSFFVHYNGGTKTDLLSYKVYVTNNGSFRFGNVGI